MSACSHCEKPLIWHGETCNCVNDFSDHAKPPKRCDCSYMAMWVRDIANRQFQCLECGKVTWHNGGKWQSHMSSTKRLKS